jgi:hypothetical protein
MKYIIDPITLQKHLCFSKNGVNTLKNYIKYYQSGGANFNINDLPIYCNPEETNCAENAEQNEELYNKRDYIISKYIRPTDFTDVLRKYINDNKDDKSCYNYRCAVKISYKKIIILQPNREYPMGAMYNHHFSILQCKKNIKLCDGWESIHPMVCRETDINGINNWIEHLRNKLSEIVETNHIKDFKNLFGEDGDLLFGEEYPRFIEEHFKIQSESGEIVNPEWTNDDISLKPTEYDPKYKFEITISELTEPEPEPESEPKPEKNGSETD